MPFNASGYYERTYDWTADKDNAIPIMADRMDTETDGIVDAINQVIAGTVSWKGPFAGVYGTAGMPAYSFVDDSDTGLFRAAADVLGLSAGGTKVAEISSAGLAVTGDVTGANVTATGAVNAASLSVSGSVTGVTKAHVGLGNADNTADADKPVSTATQAALDLKADVVETQTALDLKANTADVYLKTEVDSAISSAFAASIPFYATGAPLPEVDIGPIWHDDFASIMRWDGIGYSSLDVGQTKFFALSNPPAGYLVENGAALSRTTYAGLFRAIGTVFGAGDGSTTFNIPETRGEFIRALDSGRGVDAGRALGAAQADSIKNHTHYYTAPAKIPGYTYGAGPYSVLDTQAGQYTSEGGGGTETRGRNIARLACIKF